MTGTLTSPAGWVDANAYTNFLPLIMLLLTIGYGADSIAGQNGDGTLCLLVALPLPRQQILAQKIATMLTQALVLTVTVAACVYLGRAFDVTLDPWHLATASLAVLALAIDLGLIALALGRRGRASPRLSTPPQASCAWSTSRDRPPLPPPCL